LNIVIMGAGALGSLFGGLLSQHNVVTLVGRSQHMEAIQMNGLQITGATELVVSLKCVTDINDCAIPDLIILAVKAYDTEKVVEECAPILGTETRILTFQNGLSNTETILKHLPANLMIGGITSHGATSISDGVVKHGGIGETKIGWLDGHLDEDILKIARSFTASGIETTISTNIERDIWAKAIVNSAINSLTALQGEENGCILNEPTLTSLARAVVEEGVKVANNASHSFDIKEVFDLTMKVAEDTSNNRSSMLQDIDNNRRTEIEQINGVISRIGSSSGVATPINDALIMAVKAREKGHIDKTILNEIVLQVS